jgi:acyl carrier protein
MANPNIADRMCWLIADALGLKLHYVLPKKRLMEDLGADSLDMVEIAMRTQKEFEIEFADEELERVHTVGDAIALVQAKLTPGG